MTASHHEKFCEKIEMSGDLCGGGKLPLNKVPQNVIINADTYLSDVLKLILWTKLPQLCPGETAKVCFHYDSASSHTAKKVGQYAKEIKKKLGVTIIPNKGIPMKSPDTSFMDFYSF